jgi:hypothetical protein
VLVTLSFTPEAVAAAAGATDVAGEAGKIGAADARVTGALAAGPSAAPLCTVGQPPHQEHAYNKRRKDKKEGI